MFNTTKNTVMSTNTKLTETIAFLLIAIVNMEKGIIKKTPKKTQILLEPELADLYRAASELSTLIKQ